MKKYLIINKSIENILIIMVLILTISAIAGVKTIQNRMLVMEYRDDYRQVMELLDDTAVMAKSSMDKNDADSFK